MNDSWGNGTSLLFIILQYIYDSELLDVAVGHDIVTTYTRLSSGDLRPGCSLCLRPGALHTLLQQ
jgi:hypothetical protein